MTLTDTTTAPESSAADAAGQAGDEFMFLDLALIVESRTNPRKVFYTDRLDELANSIRAAGVHQPILVRPLPASRLGETFDDRRAGDPLPAYEIIAGHRRFRASKLAGKDDIPAIIKRLDDAAVLELQLIENLQRDDLHPLEEAEGYERLIQETGISKPDLGAKIGKSREYVYTRLKLLSLCSQAREAFLKHEIDSSRATVIARIPVEKLQIKALEEATRKDWTGGHAVSFAAFDHWCRQHVMLPLNRARFPITDATLLEGATSCPECPKRTGAQPEVYPDAESADICTDPTCFHAKEQALLGRAAEQARAQGRQVIEAAEARALLMPYHTHRFKGYYEIDKPSDMSSLQGVDSESIRQVLGHHCPTPITLIDPNDGRPVDVLPVSQVHKIAATHRLAELNQARREEAKQTEQAAQPMEERRDFQNRYQRAALGAAHAKLRGWTGPVPASLLRSMLLFALSEYDEAPFAAVLDLPAEFDTSDVEARLLAATDESLPSLFIRWALEDGNERWGAWSEASRNQQQPRHPLWEALHLAKVDVTEVMAATKREIEAEDRAKELAAAERAAAKSEKSSAPPAAGTEPRKGKAKNRPAGAAPKTSEGEARNAIAAALQAAEGKDQAPDGAGLEHAAAPAAASGQAAAAAVEEEGAAPAAPAAKVAHQVGDRVRVRRPGHQDDGIEGTVTQVRRSGKIQVCIPDPDGGESTYQLFPMDWLESLATSLWPFPGTKLQTDAAPDAEPPADVAAAPSAEAPEFKLFDLARVKADSKVHSKSRGRVGRVAGLTNDGRVQLRFGPRSHELLMVETAELEPYSCALSLMPGHQVRVLRTGMTEARADFMWRTGEAKQLQADGWVVAFPAEGDKEACEATFGPEELELLS